MKFIYNQIIKSQLKQKYNFEKPRNSIRSCLVFIVINARGQFFENERSCLARIYTLDLPRNLPRVSQGWVAESSTTNRWYYNKIKFKHSPCNRHQETSKFRGDRKKWHVDCNLPVTVVTFFLSLCKNLAISRNHAVFRDFANKDYYTLLVYGNSAIAMPEVCFGEASFVLPIQNHTWK